MEADPSWWCNQWGKHIYPKEEEDRKNLRTEKTESSGENTETVKQNDEEKSQSWVPVK